MPSRGEGFGFAFLEAMVHRKPVIAGIHDAAVEVVRHGETGLLVNPTDSSELTSALVRLLGDSSLRLHMGRHGAEVVAREFSFDTFRDRLYGHLLDVLGRERRSGNRVEARNPTGS
jgi:glycosyltransferase involved in cell wall biosynthesis